VRRALASIGFLLLLGGGLFVAWNNTGSDEASAARHVVVSERDFHITAPQRVSAGDVNFTVDNRGPDAHELIVVRGRVSSLPLRSDGLTVDEDAVSKREAGALEPANPGASRSLPVDLKPGHYVMFCNMYGHFESGMHEDLVVR
jgi:uncharacterized cupredoxin-like copper-binding protein